MSAYIQKQTNANMLLQWSLHNSNDQGEKEIVRVNGDIRVVEVFKF